MKIRAMVPEDYEEVIDLQLKCFPGMKPWSREQWDSQQQIFAEGQICIEYDGDIVASSSSLIVDFDHYDAWQDWKQIADGGFIRNHDPEGDTLYGIEIMVDPECRGMKLARRLYEARKELARQRNLQRIILGGRIPGYCKHAANMSAREYVEQVMKKNMIDPVLTPQISNGFVLKQLIPNYMPSDKESCGYATFLEWINLEYEVDRTRRFRAVSMVRICVVQYMMRRITSFEEFAKQCEFFTDVASDYKSDFIVFPELFTTQLLSLIRAKRPGLAARKLSEYTPKYLDLFNDLAVKYNVNIIGGSQFTFEEDNLYNVSYLFRRNGVIGRQYKIHATPNERKWWGISAGSRVEVFDTDRGKISILICYDIEFPELARVATAKGANIIFVPFNTDERYGYLRVRHCAQARAIENQVYVAIAGCTGNLPFVENADVHYAQSGVFTPSDFPFARDAVASESTPNIETVIIHDVDVEMLRRHRLSGTVRTWNDRRKDLYRVVYQEPGGDRLEV
ncbi:MAG: bifunctional GNAT family N-acetyltransferase/carbon-nitrogen hydrolase family protein [Planctomycetia bacterium]|nr:bifunctional GNAT family N-acetyltransferase/carbon-nitrogen hydrolase family protein [Planctomycetia bacterium]MCC7313185.1 bifunctional GNAT family N-acetyltransferase/carbon-nitrogen hydrolase family protein [Planctomycetota bacterium]